MTRVRPSSDIRPLSEFRANAAALVRHVQGTKRPLVLTQRGRSAAVLLDVEAYDALVEQVEVLRDVKRAEREVAADRGVPHRSAITALRRRLAE